MKKLMFLCSISVILFSCAEPSVKKQLTDAEKNEFMAKLMSSEPESTYSFSASNVNDDKYYFEPIANDYFWDNINEDIEPNDLMAAVKKDVDNYLELSADYSHFVQLRIYETYRRYPTKVNEADHKYHIHFLEILLEIEAIEYVRMVRLYHSGLPSLAEDKSTLLHVRMEQMLDTAISTESEIIKNLKAEYAAGDIAENEFNLQSATHESRLAKANKAMNFLVAEN